MAPERCGGNLRELKDFRSTNGSSQGLCGRAQMSRPLCHVLCPGRCRTRRGQLERAEGHLPESQGHNLALTVLFVPYSLGSGHSGSPIILKLPSWLCGTNPSTLGRKESRSAVLPRCRGHCATCSAPAAAESGGGNLREPANGSSQGHNLALTDVLVRLRRTGDCRLHLDPFAAVERTRNT